MYWQAFAAYFCELPLASKHKSEVIFCELVDEIYLEEVEHNNYLK